MTHEEFLGAFKLLELNYEKEIPDAIIRLWYENFKDVKKEIFEESIIDAIKEERFFPTMNIVDFYVMANGKRVL